MCPHSSQRFLPFTALSNYVFTFEENIFQLLYRQHSRRAGGLLPICSVTQLFFFVLEERCGNSQRAERLFKVYYVNLQNHVKYIIYTIQLQDNFYLHSLGILLMQLIQDFHKYQIQSLIHTYIPACCYFLTYCKQLHCVMYVYRSFILFFVLI